MNHSSIIICKKLKPLHTLSTYNVDEDKLIQFIKDEASVNKTIVLNVYSREFSYFLVGETGQGGSGEREKSSNST